LGGLVELQELLDEWLVAGWQNRPHAGLRDPCSPGRMFTPNEKYAALVQAAGYVPVALSADDYIELLPATWRVINAYGIKISHRVYDGDALNPLRRQPSGVAERRNLWEVHHDPYDVTRVWLRNHRDGGWITLFRKHLRSTPAPFGELAWNHALGQLRAQGKDPTEAEIAAAVGNLLERAHRAPEPGGTQRGSSRRDRRVVARTHAAPSALSPPPTTPTGPGAPVRGAGPRPDPEPDEEPLAEVIPLAVFDAHEEAKRWW
jgi:putative transposase